jgi:hypothetical protein
MAHNTWLSARANRYQEACFLIQPQAPDLDPVRGLNVDNPDRLTGTRPQLPFSSELDATLTTVRCQFGALPARIDTLFL